MQNRKRYDIKYNLSLDESLIIKAIAICLMLWHHLFYEHPEFGIFVFQTAQFGKVCVSLFLFVSAYGLTIQYGKVYDKPVIETFKFQAKRLVKFYANYWVIFLIFVPLGIFVFGRGLDVPYENANHVKMLVKDMLGINRLSSYNVTWWFNRLIICLYLLFPLIYFAAKKYPVLLLALSVASWQFGLPVISDWLVVFSIGSIYALHIDKVSNVLNKINVWLLLGLFPVTLFILFCIRQIPIIPFFNGVRVDSLIALNIVVAVIFTVRHIHTAACLLGKHSINIYMIHTFIFYYFFRDFIYSFQYPIVIFAALLLVSLTISIVIEYLKRIIQLSIFVKHINRKIEEVNI